MGPWKRPAGPPKKITPNTTPVFGVRWGFFVFAE
jgi:hypothetical protein